MLGPSVFLNIFMGVFVGFKLIVRVNFWAKSAIL